MLNNPYRRSPTERHWDQICIGFFSRIPRVVLRLLTLRTLAPQG